jgi:ATP-binding cassette subfamily B protein
MLLLDARLTVLLLLLAPPCAVSVLRRRMRVLASEFVTPGGGHIPRRADDGVEVIQLFSHEQAAERKFDEHNDRFRRATSRSNVYDSFMFAVVDGAAAICVAVMLWYGSGLAAEMGAPLVRSTPISVGLLVAFIEYLDRLFRPLRELSSDPAATWDHRRREISACRPSTNDPVGGAPLPEIRGHLVLRDVWFRYRPDAQDVLRGVDLEVKPREVVAIVGATGSGKTTLTRLLDASYRGYRGSIRLDGHELSDLTRGSSTPRAAFVGSQLFSDGALQCRPRQPVPRRPRAAAPFVSGSLIARLGHVLRGEMPTCQWERSGSSPSRDGCDPEVVISTGHGRHRRHHREADPGRPSGSSP